MKEVIKEFYGINYIIREDGKIFSTSNRGRGKYHQEIKQRLDSDNYLCVTLGANEKRTRKRVHRVIAETFIKNPNNLSEVDHINNDRLNNHVSNLQWLSSFDNKVKIPFEHRSECHKGEKNGRSKLNNQKVKEIREKYKSQNYSIQNLAKEYNCGWTTISHIINNETWKDI